MFQDVTAYAVSPTPSQNCKKKDSYYRNSRAPSSPSHRRCGCSPSSEQNSRYVSILRARIVDYLVKQGILTQKEQFPSHLHLKLLFSSFQAFALPRPIVPSSVPGKLCPCSSLLCTILRRENMRTIGGREESRRLIPNLSFRDLFYREEFNNRICDFVTVSKHKASSRCSLLRNCPCPPLL